jgi:hypothetical protein
LKIQQISTPKSPPEWGGGDRPILKKLKWAFYYGFSDIVFPARGGWTLILSGELNLFVYSANSAEKLFSRIVTLFFIG